MLDWMDNFLDTCEGINLAEATKFKVMKVLRNALVDECFSEREANLIACKMELEVSDNAYNEYQERIDGQLARFAKVVFRLFEQVSVEFDMDVDMFIDTFAKDLSFKMEI